MARGEHIKVRRWIYSHHGIDCGDGTVIHYTGSPFRRINAAIRQTPLDEFTAGKKTFIVPYDPQPLPDEVVERASVRLGEKRYNVVINNCEHFATWYMTGKSQSIQVRRAIKATLVIVGGVLAVVAVREKAKRDTGDTNT